MEIKVGDSFNRKADTQQVARDQPPNALLIFRWPREPFLPLVAFSERSLQVQHADGSLLFAGSLWHVLTHPSHVQARL